MRGGLPGAAGHEQKHPFFWFLREAPSSPPLSGGAGALSNQVWGQYTHPHTQSGQVCVDSQGSLVPTSRPGAIAILATCTSCLATLNELLCHFTKTPSTLSTPPPRMLQ